MITELAIWGLSAYALKKYFIDNDTKKIKGSLQKIFHDAKVEGLRNRNDETFSISKVYRHEYGYLITVHIALGCSSEALEGLKTIIEDNMKCKCEIAKDDFGDYVRIKIITNPLNNLIFKSVPTKPYQLFLGNERDGKAHILDMENPHLLISGKSGQGKTRLLYCAITNLLYNHSEKEIELYFSQISKREMNKFKKCKQVKFFTNDLNETEIMLKKLNGMINERTSKFEKMGLEDIFEWNNRMKKHYMKFIYIFIDEFSFYMPSDADTEQDRAYKLRCLQYVKNIGKAGRAAGLFIVTAVQRSTISNVPSDLKSVMNRLSFAQKTKIDSINMIEIDDALKLKKQECILSSDDFYWLKVPYIDIDIMKEHIPEIITFDDKIVEIEFEENNSNNKLDNDPNITIVNVNSKEKEHEEWCRERGIKITEIDLSKLRKEKQEQISKEYKEKENTSEPVKNNYNSKKGKISLTEEVATTNVDAER